MFRKLETEKLKTKGMNNPQQPDSGIHDTSTHCPRVQSFNLLGPIVPEKSMMKNFYAWNLERKKNEEIKEQISSSLIPVYMIHLTIVCVYTKFQSSRPHSSWEKCDEKFSFERLWNDRITEDKANPV